MILIVGLGNPGRKFQKTRHNLGFRVVDEFLRKNRDVYFFSDFKLQKELSSLISEGEFNNKKIVLAKPQTFMNNSGRSSKSLIQTYFINNTMVLLSKCFWVVHDDIDLPLGNIRIVKNRGAGGHKGIESIIRELKTKNFVRFRLGIKNKELRIKNTERFVLQRFNKDEEKDVKEVIKKTAEAIALSIKKGVEKAQSKYNACGRHSKI